MRGLGTATAIALMGMLLGCKSHSEVSTNQEHQKVEQANRLVQEAQQLLKEERYSAAARDAEAAGLLLKTDAAPYLLLFEIRRAEGNGPAAALALQQAADLKPAVQSYLRKQLAEMYRQDGRWIEAIAVLKQLAASGYLNEAEYCTLARLQVRMGDTIGATNSLRKVMEVDPHDPEAQTVKAEILMASGDSAQGTELMNRMIQEHPDLASARFLRARYYLHLDRSDDAILDLSHIQGPQADNVDVILLKVAILERRHQLDEAEKLLQDASDRQPREVNLLARLAEVKLDLRKADEGEELAEAALSQRPGSPRARYVLGRVAEMKGRFPEAIHTYEQALQADPTLAPALSHLWPLLRAANEKTEAMAVLERLAVLDEATIPEKIAVAQMYLEAKTQFPRALRYVQEALRRYPDNPKYAALQTAIKQAMEKKRASKGVVILRGPRHR